MQDYVIMPRSDYKSMCDSVRSHTGGTEGITSGAMVSSMNNIIKNSIKSVDDLPTENIEESSIYKIKEIGRVGLYVIPQADTKMTLEAFFELQGISITTEYHVVSELPEAMDPFSEATLFVPVYILKNSGVAYITPDGTRESAMSAGDFIFSEPSMNAGWVDDIENASNLGIYAVATEVESYWQHKNGSWRKNLQTLDVQDIPTDNIEENVLYRTAIQREEVTGATVYWYDGNEVKAIHELGVDAGFATAPNIILVDSVPTTGQNFGEGSYFIYVNKSTGVAYVMVDGTAKTLAGALAGGIGIDVGWADESFVPTDVCFYSIKNMSTTYSYQYSISQDDKLIDYKDADSVELAVSASLALFINGGNNEDFIIPDGTTEIADYAFYGRKYKSITIPKSVTKIGNYAFSNCTDTSIIYNGLASDLLKIEFGEASVDTLITCIDGDFSTDGIKYELRGTGNSYMVSGAVKTIRVANIPSVINGLPVDCIGDKAFNECMTLTTVTLPDTMTLIAYCAFRSCHGLSNITIPANVTQLDESAFGNCYGLYYVKNYSDIELTPNVGACPYAKIVEDKDGVRTTLNDAEYILDEQGYLYGVHDDIYTLYSYIGNEDTITLPQNINGNQYNVYRFSTTARHVIIPGTITHIDANAFHYCGGITDVTIEEGVISIAGGSFASCSSLANVSLPNSLTSIGDSAFEYCYSLKSITIPQSVTFIGGRAFESCIRLASISLPNASVEIKSRAFRDTAYYNNKENWDDGVLYIGNHLIAENEAVSGECIIKDGTIDIADSAFYYGNACKVTSVIVPGSVQRIGEHAFAYCLTLNSVTLGNGITNIGPSAFFGCSALSNIFIPDSVISIGADAFESTAYYKDETNWENSVLYIGNHIINAKTDISGDYVVKNGTVCIADEAFYGCKNLTNISFPNSTISIGKNAFSGCSALAAVTMQSGITTIGYGAFLGCTNLLNINIPDSVTDIGDSAFCQCETLARITIPRGVNIIRANTFFNCTSLNSVVISSSVTGIEDKAFSRCTSLTDVYYTGSADEWDTIEIGQLDNDYLTSATIHYNWSPATE